jgi:hypothetical protein
MSTPAPPPERRDMLDTGAFRALMERLSTAWESLDTDAGVACFTPDALYMEPPDMQLYVGHEQLRPYFAALTPGVRMIWHGLWFDEDRQTGVGEYTFGWDGHATADHGVAVVDVRSGAIARWREYQRKGPMPFDRFLAREDKSWQWTIANYP